MAELFFKLVVLAVFGRLIHLQMQNVRKYIMEAMDALPERTRFELNLTNAATGFAWALFMAAAMGALIA